MKDFYFLFTAFFILLFTTLIYAQQQGLFIPVEMQRAYQKQTRSIEGKPGPQYWQNSSKYTISVTLDTATRVLSGKETIIYKNNSPDSLGQLVIRLYQNLNKPGAQRDFSLDTNALNEGVKIKSLIIGSDTLNPEDKILLTYSGTVLTIDLLKKVYSGQSVDLQISWTLTIPDTDQVRMGAYSKTDYMVAFWYPQIAVYDDLYGWDKIEYTGQAEFYNDFSDYDVEINVPMGFSVWATGTLQNKEELFTEKYLERYNRAMNSEEVINIIGPKDQDKQIYKQNARLKWHYKASSVTDFAFAMSNRYLWDGVSAVVDSITGRKVFVSAAYKPVSKDFYEVAQISKQIVESMSHELPGIPYPYPAMTVFNGGGGMEYPMMVNDASSAERWETIHLTAHEISHTYFPFYMGTNETRFAWMDEGWAVMLPAVIQARLSPGYQPRNRNTLSYLKYAGSYQDVPPMVASFILKENFYWSASYNRAGAAYHILRDILGKEVFANALKKYITTWNGKHPMPYDFFFTFNKAAGRDLTWFWKPWFFEFGYPDLAITEAKQEGTKIRFKVRQDGNMPLPISAKIYLTNGKTIGFYENAEIWSSGSKEIWLETEIEHTASYINLEDPEIPDIYHTNNFYKF